MNAREHLGGPAQGAAAPQTTEMTDPYAPTSRSARPLSRRARPWLSLGARLILAGVLATAGLLKIADPGASVRTVTAYELLPSSLERITGYGLPFVEIGLAVLLIVGLATRFAAAATAVLMVAFMAAVGSAWARGLSIDCGCFGGGGEVDAGDTRYVEEILRDLGLLVVAGWLLLFPAGPYSLDPQSD